MPVLSEDSGECLPGLVLRSPKDKNLPSSQAGRKVGRCQRWLSGAAVPPSPGNESLGRECSQDRAEVLFEGPLGVPTWGLKGSTIAFAILCFPYAPLRLA